MLGCGPWCCRAGATGRTTRPVGHGCRRDGNCERDRDGRQHSQKHRPAPWIDPGNGGGVECCLHCRIIKRAALRSLRDRLGRRLARRASRSAAGRLVGSAKLIWSAVRRASNLVLAGVPARQHSPVRGQPLGHSSVKIAGVGPPTPVLVLVRVLQVGACQSQTRTSQR